MTRERARELAAALALLLVFCGKKGPPLPPLPQNPQPITELEVGQEGDALVVSFVAPQTTLQGQKLGALDVDLVVASGTTALDKAKPTTVRVNPGERRRETLPLPEPGTAARVIGRARYKGTRSLSSKLVTFEVQPPVAAPESLSATNDPAGILLVWPTPAPTEPPVATTPPEDRPKARAGTGGGYTVRRRVGTDGEITLLTPRAISGPPYVDDAAQPGRTYCYTVRRAVSSEPRVTSVDSAPACILVTDAQPPEPPAGVTLVPHDTALELTWSAPAATDVASYRIYRALPGKELERVAERPATERQYSDSSVEKGIRYRYTVTAVDTAGNESASSGPAEGALP